MKIQQATKNEMRTILIQATEQNGHAKERRKYRSQHFHKNVPVADIGERLLVCDIVHKKNAHGAAVVSGGDGAKPLPTGSVPNLQFAALVENFDSAKLEIDANG